MLPIVLKDVILVSLYNFWLEYFFLEEPKIEAMTLNFGTKEFNLVSHEVMNPSFLI